MIASKLTPISLIECVDFEPGKQFCLRRDDSDRLLEFQATSARVLEDGLRARMHEICSRAEFLTRKRVSYAFNGWRYQYSWRIPRTSLPGKLAPIFVPEVARDAFEPVVRALVIDARNPRPGCIVESWSYTVASFYHLFVVTVYIR